MLMLQGLHYAHPNKDVLFAGIDLTVNKHQKIALVGNNGTGKSTLLKLLAGQLQPSGGVVKADPPPYFVPQILGQFNHLTVAGALQIDGKLTALQQILAGDVTEDNLATLNDDWEIEQRCAEAFAYWGLDDIRLDAQMASLSGGQKTKVFLAGIQIHRPGAVLLDEPSNHLDVAARELLYRYIRTAKQTLVVVSHDRTLLNLLDTVCELSARGITTYGGNYEFYAEQKQLQADALEQDIRSKEKALRKAKEVERESAERQQKLDARGKKKQEKAGVPKIMMNTLRNKAENSTSKLADVHAEKTGNIARELSALRKEQPAADKMKMDLDNSSLHKGKVLIDVETVNFNYGQGDLWADALSFQIRSGERIAIKGANGSGKTTLIRMILGRMVPTSGLLNSAVTGSIYVDQDYSLIDDSLTVYQQAEKFNSGILQEHDIRIRLDRFLFGKDDLDKPCRSLSGGEKMRLILCSLTIQSQAPDMIILDEPTNNLDLQNIGILTAAINDYRGTLLIVSHDAYFLDNINIAGEISV